MTYRDGKNKKTSIVCTSNGWDSSFPESVTASKSQIFNRPSPFPVTRYFSFILQGNENSQSNLNCSHDEARNKPAGTDVTVIIDSSLAFSSFHVPNTKKFTFDHYCHNIGWNANLIALSFHSWIPKWSDFAAFASCCRWTGCSLSSSEQIV